MKKIFVLLLMSFGVFSIQAMAGDTKIALNASGPGANRRIVCVIDGKSDPNCAPQMLPFGTHTYSITVFGKPKSVWYFTLFSNTQLVDHGDGVTDAKGTDRITGVFGFSGTVTIDPDGTIKIVPPAAEGGQPAPAPQQGSQTHL